MKWIKAYWLLKEGFNKQINGWHINTSELIAVDERTIKGKFWEFYKGRVNGCKFGSWIFYSHNKLNPDVLDTLRHSFAVPKQTNTYKRLL